MMNNSRDNSNNSITILPFDGRPFNGSSSSSSILGLIEVAVLLLTIIFATAYTLLIIIRPTFRRTKLNWFTINVCITSVLLCVNILLISATENFHTFDPLPCRVQAFLLLMASSQLMYSHFIAAFSRLLAIVYANKRFFRSKICLWSCIGVGWLVAFLLSLVYLFVDGFICSSYTKSKFLSCYLLVTSLVLPVVIIAVCNGWILLHVRKSTRRVQTTYCRRRVSHTRDIYLLKIMIVTFITFFIGWSPLIITETFGLNSRIPAIINSCIQLLPSLTMLHNVIFLIYTNQPVRLFLKQLLVKRCRKEQIKPMNIALQHNVHK